MGASPRLVAILGISLNPLTLAKDVVKAFVNSATSLFATGAASLVRALLGFVTTTSDPVFSGGWWSSAGEATFERIGAVSASVLALSFMLAIITAVVSGNHALLARAVLHLPLAVLQTALLVGVAGALVSASDEIAAAVAKGATGTLSGFVATAMAASITTTGIVGIVCAGVVILAALAIWAELLMRTALVYVAVMTGPLVFAAAVHPAARGIQRRYVEMALALICSKIVIAVAFATGSAMLEGLSGSTSFSAALGGLMEAIAVLVVAAFSPFVLLKLFGGAETILAAEGLARRPARAALEGIGAATTVSGFAGMLRGLGSSAAASPPSSSPGSTPPSTGAAPPPSSAPPAPGSSATRPGHRGPDRQPSPAPEGTWQPPGDRPSRLEPPKDLGAR